MVSRGQSRVTRGQPGSTGGQPMLTRGQPRVTGVSQGTLGRRELAGVSQWSPRDRGSLVYFNTTDTVYYIICIPTRVQYCFGIFGKVAVPQLIKNQKVEVKLRPILHVVIIADFRSYISLCLYLINGGRGWFTPTKKSR